MPKWSRTIKLQPEWSQAQSEEISIREMASVIAKKLRNVRDFLGDTAYLNDERDEIAEEFEWLASTDDAETADFDQIMDRLYDWGDTQISGKFFDAVKVCWIDTINGSP